MSVTWETEITHDGVWPKTWRWMVRWSAGPPTFKSDLRLGDAWTKDGARRAAVKARRSMETEDVRVVDVA